MKKGSRISAILRSKKTVFTFKDFILLWRERGANAARVRADYYVRNGGLYRIRRGLYAKDKDYNKLELATRIFTPSYVSFETVLIKEGINFQFYNSIFAASYLSRKITVDGQMYVFKKIKNSLLTNPAGIENKDEVAIAAKERAVLDTLYINKDYYFDNLRFLDWEKIFKILPIYKNKRMNKIVKKLFDRYQANK